MDFLACEHPLSVFFWYSFLIAAYFRSCFATRFIFWKIILIRALKKNPQKFPPFHEDAWSRHIIPVFFFLCIFAARNAIGFLLTRFSLNTKVIFACSIHKGTTSPLFSLPSVVEQIFHFSALIYPASILSWGDSLRFTQLLFVALGSLYSHNMYLQSHFIILGFCFML